MLSDKVYASLMVPLSLALAQRPGLPRHARPIGSSWMLTVIVLCTGFKDKMKAFLTFPELEPIPASLANFALPQSKLEQLMVKDGVAVRKLEVNNFVTISIVCKALWTISGLTVCTGPLWSL